MRSYYKGVARDQYGAIIGGATIAIYLAGTTTVASVYTVSIGGTAVNSVTADIEGVFYFYVDTSDYSNIQLFKLVISYLGNTTTYDNISAFYYDNYYIDALGEYGSGTAYTQSTIEAALTAIGTTNKATMLLRPGTWAVTADLTIPANVTLKTPAGAVLSIATGKTLTINGPFEAGDYQIFSCTGTGKVAWLRNSNPVWFGAKFDNSTDDAAAWKSSMDAISSYGGVLNVPAGVSKVASTIIWPYSGLYTVDIKIVGKNAAPFRDPVGAVTGGISQINYTGSGTLFDMRGGTAALLSWYGSIENISLYGPGGATAIGLDIYRMTTARIENVEISSFGLYGLRVSNWMFYATIKELRCVSNGYGFYAPSITMVNGTTIENSSFNYSTTDGMYLGYGIGPINITNCWFEMNGRYGANILFPDLVNFNGCWFEGNTSSDMYLQSAYAYNSTANVHGCYFSPSDDHYSVITSNFLRLNATGSSFMAYLTAAGYPIANLDGATKGEMIGNKWPQVSGITPTLPRYNGNFIWNDIQTALGQSATLPTYSKVMPYGAYIHNTAPLANGGNVGWIYTVPGTGTKVTALAGVTATTTATSGTITISASTVISPGSYISIAGVDFGTSALSYARVVSITPANTTIVVDNVANQSVVGAAVSWAAPTSKRVAGMIFDSSVAAVSTSGTGEDDLRSTIIPAGMMETTSGFKVFAAGTKTNSNGNKTLKFHFGATAVTFHAAANNTNDWRFEAYVFNLANASAQGISWVGWDGATMLQGYDTAAINTAAAVTMKITGTCADGGDEITQTLWLVEPK